MSIHIGGLHSYSALAEFAESRLGWERPSRWIEPDRLAWLVVILKVTPDDPDLFLSGKWATIQHLESLLLDAARLELAKEQQS